MVDPFTIDADAIYDDGVLVLGLGVSFDALARSRRTEQLRHVRKGRRILYRGEWLIEWLERTATPAAANVKEPSTASSSA